jgi:pilus assembly protein CpaE
MTILVCHDPRTADVLTAAIGGAQVVEHLADLRRTLSETSADLVVIGPDVDLGAALAFAATVRLDRPALGVVLVRHREDTAVLTQGLRAGVRDVVPAHDTQRLGQACRASRALSEQLQRTAGIAPAAQNRRRGQIITVFGGKGGIGKSTVSTNLGIALAQSGARTCLIDLDLSFGDVAVMLSLVPERTLADAVSMADTLDAAGVESLISKHESGLHAILAPSEPRTAESVSADLVAKLFPLLTELYDIVLIDTPPAFTEHVLAAMDVSDQIVLITTPEVPSIKNLKLTLQTLDLLGFPADRRKIVLNRADIHLGLSGADVSSMIDTSVQLEVPADRAVPLSINQGVPLVAEKPKHPASRALHALATMLWREEQTISIPEQARHRSGRRGWRRQKELAR